jgi:uncharacterized protein YutD
MFDWTENENTEFIPNWNDKIKRKIGKFIKIYLRLNDYIRCDWTSKSNWDSTIWILFLMTKWKIRICIINFMNRKLREYISNWCNFICFRWWRFVKKRQITFWSRSRMSSKRFCDLQWVTLIDSQGGLIVWKIWHLWFWFYLILSKLIKTDFLFFLCCFIDRKIKNSHIR